MIREPYLRPSQVVALEAVEVRGSARRLLLEGRGMHHHGNRLISIEICLPIEAGQTEKRLLCFLELALSDKPPRRLGGKVDADDERDRPPGSLLLAQIPTHGKGATNIHWRA